MEINPAPQYLDTLAMALAEVGRFEDAVYVMDRVISTLADQKDVDDIDAYKARLNAYKKGKPWRQKSLNTMQSPKSVAKAKPPQKQIRQTAAYQKRAGAKAAFTVQAGAFLERENALNRKTRLIRKGYDARLILIKDSKGRVWHLVRFGSYDSLKAAKAAARTFSKKERIKAIVRPAGKL
jgi:cell division protein FtsN